MNLNRLNYIISILSYILNKLFRRLNKGCVLLFIFLLKHIALLLLHLFILSLKMNLKRALSGKLNAKINIVRTVSGIALPIRCYIASGVYVGSCTYDGKFNFLYYHTFNLI